MWASLLVGISGLRKRLFARHDDSPSLITRRGLVVVVFLVVFGTLFVSHPSVLADNTSNGVTEGIGNAIATAVGFIIDLMLGLVGQLLLIMIGALIWVAQYNGFVTAVPVAQGWTIVRDVTNMFFIVIMLIYAFGTILGVDAYSAKGGAIVKLLIMAVVVNFSRTICGLLIDASQVVMLTFVYGFKEAAGGNFADALGITKLMQLKNEGTVSAWSVTVSLMLALLMTSVSLMVVVVMTICLAVRIVILWLLIVMSPLAFLTRTAPGSFAKGKYADWWKKFTAQLVFGPVMAFFLWLALVSVGSSEFSGQGFPPMNSGVGNVGTVNSNASEAFGDIQIQKFIIAICLLFGGLQMAKEVADNMSVLSQAKDKVKGAYSAAKGVYDRGKTVAKGTAKVAGVAGSAGIGLVDIASGGRGTKAKNWALTQAAKVPLIGGAAEAKLSRDKAANEEVAKKAAGRASKASEELVKSRANEKLSAVTMDGQIERNEFQKKRVQDLAKKSKKKQLTQEERQEYFRLAKSIKKHGDKFDDDSGDKVLEGIEKRNPSLIVDENEKDPAERKRQAEAFVKSARSLNKQDLADMDPDALKGNAQLQAFLSPKQVLEAQKIATGDNLEALERMGSNESEIKAYQEGLRNRADVFAFNSEQDRAARVSGMSEDQLKELAGNPGVGAEAFGGSVLQAAVAAGTAGALADKLAPTLSAQTLEDNDALADQIARGISASSLASLSKDVGDVLRERVAETDPAKAMAGGAKMEQVFGGYGGDGSFDTVENRAAFEKYLQDGLTDKRAGSIPADAIARNGGINDVSISMIKNLEVSDLQKMAKDGKTGQVSELLSAMEKFSKVDTSDQAAVDKFIVENAGVTVNEQELRAVMTKAAQTLADSAGANSPIRAAQQEKATMRAVEAAARKAAEAENRRQAFERKLLGRIPKRDRRTSRNK